MEVISPIIKESLWEGVIKMSQQSVIYLLKEKLSQLSKTEKKLATWILENPKQVTTMTVTKLSEVSDASPATIVRLCYSLGLAGFTDLKFRLSREEKIIDQALHTDIVKNENVSTIKKKLKFTLNNAFEETISLLSDQDILKAVSMIEEAEIIYTFGIGASGLAASDLFQKFTRVGKSIMYSLDNHLLSTAIASTEKKKLVIVISNSGEKKEVNDLIHVAKAYDAPIIAITSNANSNTGQLADVTLLTASGIEAPIRSSATNSLMVQFYVVDTIFSTYASKHYDSVIEKLNTSKNAIDILN